MHLSARRVALACFLVLVMPLVALCAWTVPLGQVPDEPTQIARVDSVWHGEVIGYRLKTLNVASGGLDAGVTGNFGLALAAASGNGANAPLPATASAKARLAWAEAIPWSPSPSFISSVNTAAYAPIAYIPAALALGAAIQCGALPHAAAIAARFGNVLAFAILGSLALLLARRGRLLILVTLGMPMTIWLAGSCNQDGILIAVAALALALLTRMGRAAFWSGTVLLAILALQKPPFAALMLLPFAAPASATGRWTRRIPAALLIALPAVLWSIFVMRRVSVPLLPGQPYHPGPLWPGDPRVMLRSAIPADQLRVVLHHPVTAALLPLTETGESTLSAGVKLVGILGVQTVLLPAWLYTLFLLAILSAIGALLTTAPPIAARRWHFLLVLFAGLGCIELIYLVEYLTWTPVGFPRIDGMQGRYFLPLLPVLLLVLGRILPLPGRLGWIWWIAPIAALVMLDIHLPGIIRAQYYR